MPAIAVHLAALCLQYSSRSDAWRPRTVCTNLAGALPKRDCDLSATPELVSDSYRAKVALPQ